MSSRPATPHSAPDHAARPARLSRRALIAGAAAGAVLAACGSDGGGSSATPASGSPAGSSPGTAPGGGTWTLVQRFPQDVQAAGPIRLPISLSTGSAQLVQDGPDVLRAQVADLDGNAIGEPITATRRDVEPGPYYAFRTTIDTPGFYSLVVDGGPPQGAAFQVMEPGTVAVAGPGVALAPFDTPTVADARGVDPICTRQPEPCPFHDLTLTEALDSGKQVVYLVGTPAFCQTGTCAPALESIIDVADDYGDTYAFVHAEVYTDNTATTPAPAVGAAGLTYEPALFVTDRDGVVIERLDAVWDQTELVEVLDASTV